MSNIEIEKKIDRPVNFHKCSLCESESIQEFCRKKDFPLFKCENCSFIFTPLNPEELKNYYTNDYMYNNDGWGYVDYEIDKAPMRPVYESIIASFSSYRPGNRLLDIGTANGYFLDIARECGYVAEGIDINEAAILEGKRKGRSVKCEDLLVSDYRNESFDVVAALDLIEHLPNILLNDFVARVKDIMVKDGILVLITLDTSSWWARLLGKRWHAILPPEHVSYFNKVNIRQFLESNGFRIISIKTLHKKFSLQYIFHSLYRWQRLSFWRKFTMFLERRPHLGRKSFKLYVGDNVVIIAQKNGQKNTPHY